MRSVIKGKKSRIPRNEKEKLTAAELAGGKIPQNGSSGMKASGGAGKDDGAVWTAGGKKHAPGLTNPYADELMSFAHELAADLFEGGLIDQTTMREIDDLALTPVKELGPDDIKGLRVSAGFSQAVLARVCNVTTSSVSQWERGEKNPSGSALKLLSLASAKGMQAIM